MNYDVRIDSAPGAPLDAADPLAEVEIEDRRSRRRMIIGGVIVALLLVAVWFMLHRNDAPAGADAAAANQAPVVSVIAPGRGTIEGTINATGTLGARREMPVGVAGEGGQVVRVVVEAGQWVGQGQVLAVVDRSVQTQQQNGQAAQIQVAQADARLAQANLNRSLKLVARGFVSKADVDRLTATRDAANARVRVASAQLGELQARTRRLDILAPAAGLVLARNVEPGQIISPGSGVLFRIARGGEMELLAQLSEIDLAAIAPGTTAQVTPVGSTKVYTGQVWQVSPVIDPQSRQGTARIALSYAEDLRPGGFATATIKSGTVVAPMLPESAILSDAKGSYVYIVGKGNKAERRDIKTGLVTDQGIAIASGLSGNERVILRAGGFLSPGEAINPRLAPATPPQG